MKRYLALILIVLIAVFAAGGTFAQDETEDDSLIVVSGPISFEEDGSIMVGDYIIAPAGAFIPGQLEDGTEVIITGYLLPDDATIQAFSLELEEDEDEDDADDEGDDEGDTEDDDEEADDEEEGDDEELDEIIFEGNGFYCQNPDMYHPAGISIADSFDVEYGDVMTAFCEDRVGFGQITRAFLIAQAAELEDDELLAVLEARAAGEKWRDIMDEYDIHPSDLAPGRARGNQPWADDEGAEGDTPGNSGNGRGNAGGNGNGNGNAGGNGNGRGNGGGNGNGNPGGGPPANPGNSGGGGNPGNGGGNGNGRGGR